MNVDTADSQCFISCGSTSGAQQRSLNQSTLNKYRKQERYGKHNLPLEHKDPDNNTCIRDKK